MIYSRRQYKVSVTYRSVPVYRPYRTLKKRLARPYHFVLLGVTQYYCYTRSEYRAESSSMWIFLVVYCFVVLPACFLLGRSTSVHRLFLLFSSINRFSSGQVRSSPSTQLFLLLLVASSTSVRRLFMVFYSPVPLHSVDCFCSSCRLKASLLARFALVRRLFLLF